MIIHENETLNKAYDSDNCFKILIKFCLLQKKFYKFCPAWEEIELDQGLLEWRYVHILKRTSLIYALTQRIILSG